MQYLTICSPINSDRLAIYRGVVPGGAVNPISTRGTDYAHLITTGTPGFSDLPTALIYNIQAAGIT